MRPWRRRQESEQAPEQAAPHASERAPRPIWLPQMAEPVSLVLRSGEKLPGRVIERSADALVVAVVVPARRVTQARLKGLVLEYANPAGRVRLTGQVELTATSPDLLVSIEQPRLLDVLQERAHARVSVICPITIRLDDDDEPIHTHTADLSGGGALLATPEPLRVGDGLQFTLTIEPGQPPVEGGAEVVRIDGSGRPGIQFGLLANYDRWRLIHFTVECQSREGFRHLDHGERRANP